MQATLALVMMLVPAAAAHAQPPLTVEPVSLMTTPVYLFQGNRQISQGTGFFYGVANAANVIDTVFLVTNYHVVTGNSPNTTLAAKGDRVIFYLHTDKQDPARVKQVALPLYSTAGVPQWVQSEEHPEADLVLVPLPPEVYSGIEIFVFDESHTRGKITIRPTSPATLLGYPYGFSDDVNRLPVWKTGHVASEPNVDFQGKPSFLVDVSAFPGMSGSPVLAVANGVYEDDQGAMGMGRVIRLLGVFSAMPVMRSDIPGMPDTSLELGIVWKSSIIVELARKYRR
ncbi:MAG: trypsin-like peptidase domain-containing protein [Acidobacteria bacterium]|nr:trypsin-like peptidase domain-containing protein [Acidobacteriota bacterium]